MHSIKATMNKAIFGGLLAAAFCAGNVEAIGFSEGYSRPGESADTYSNVGLPGWIYDNVAGGSSVPYAWNNESGPDFAGIILGDSLGTSATFVFREYAVKSLRIEGYIFGSGTWSMTAFDELGNTVAFSTRTVTGDGWIATDDSIARDRSGPFEPYTPIYSIRIDFDAPFAIDNFKSLQLTDYPIVTAPDGGATGILLALGCLGLFQFRRRH